MATPRPLPASNVVWRLLEAVKRLGLVGLALALVAPMIGLWAYAAGALLALVAPAIAPRRLGQHRGHLAPFAFLAAAPAWITGAFLWIDGVARSRGYAVGNRTSELQSHLLLAPTLTIALGIVFAVCLVRRHRAVESVVAALLPVLLLVTVLLGAVGLGRSLTRPTGAEYVDTLPVYAEWSPSYDEWSQGTGPRNAFEEGVVRVDVACLGGPTCRVDFKLHGQWSVLSSSIRRADGATPIQVRIDAAQGLWWLTNPDATILAAIDDATGEPVAVPVARATGNLSPPGAPFVALAGAFSAALLAMFAASRSRTLARLARGFEGRVDGEGWVTFFDERLGSMRLPDHRRVSAGPVVVMSRRLREDYRSAPERDLEVVGGTIAEHAAHARARRTEFRVWALVALVIGAAPLVAIAAYGLLL